MSPRIRALAALGLGLAVATCRDALGPHGTGAGQGRVVFAPVLPSEAALASFGLAIDQVRIVVVRPGPPPDTLADTTLALPPDSEALDLDIHVALLSSPETLSVSVIALSGTQPLFQGTDLIEVTTGGDTPTPTEIPIDTYVGPGAGVDSIDIVPAAPFIYWSDSLRFQVQAFDSGGAPVTQFYVAWSTSDSSIARVNGFGVLRAPASRTSVAVRARTPSGASDSVIATFVPLPTQVVKVAGDGQSGAAGGALSVPLQVEVRAGDNLPVGGVGVRFRALAAGGAPADTTVTSNGAGRAQVTGTLGSAIGAQSFQVTVPAFPAIPAVTFGATATAATAKTIALVSGSGQTDTIGKVLAAPFVVVVRDTFNNVVSGARVAWSVVLGNGTPSADTTTTLANGQTSVTYQLGAVPGIDTVRATLVGTTATATFVATAIAPAPARIAFTVEPSSATSGSAITPAIQVTVLDGSGNPLPTATNSITLSLGVNPGGDTLSGTKTVSAVNGVATFSGLSLGKAASGYRLIATSAGLVPDTSVAFAITPGAPVALAFTVQPSAAAAGTAIAPAVQVAVTDAAGNIVSAASDSITVALGTNPSSGVLSGTLTVGASAGVASFADLRIDQPGTGYTLMATGTGLAPDTSAAFDVAPPASVVFWANASGGNWSNPANWSGGAVPALGDTAVINLSGTYTVTFDVADTIGGLKIGGASGTQTLLVGSQALGVGGALDVNAGGVLDVRNPGQLSGLGTLTNAGTVKLRGTIVAKPFANAGTLYVEGGTTLSSGLTTTATSLIRVQGNGTTGFSQLSVGSGFTNNGTITLTDSTSAYGAGLNVAGGPLVNAAGALLVANQGSGGPRQINASLDNQGTFTVAPAAGQAVTLAAPVGDAGHANTGAIVISSGALNITQAGPSFVFTSSGSISASGGKMSISQPAAGTVTLTGSLTVGATDSFAVNAGTFNYNSGAQIGGLGTIHLKGGVTANFTPSFATDSMGLVLQSATLNGPGTITNAAGRSLSMRASTINAPFVNNGSLFVDGSSVLGGAVTTGGTSSIRIQGNGTTGFSQLTVASGFTNNGQIVLTDSTAAYGAGLDVTTGTLVNAAGASIIAPTGSAGPRQLNAQFSNQGSLTVATAANQGLTMAHASAVDSNTGTITVASGDLTITQSGVNPSLVSSGTLDFSGGNFTLNQGGTGTFTLTGGVTVGAADTFKVSSGTFNYNAGATIGGAGALALIGGVTANFTPSFADSVTSLVLVNATVNGPGTITNLVGHTLAMRASTINAPFVNNGTLQVDGNSALGGSFTTATTSSIRIQGNGTTGLSRLTVANGFTNNGQIQLTDSTAAYGAGLDVTSGVLINAVGAGIDASQGAAGPRQLNAQFYNRGTITVDVAPGQSLTVAHAAAADSNTGTIVVASGALNINQSGVSSLVHTGTLTLSGGGFTLSQAGGAFSTTGTISIAAGQTLALSGGTFNYASGTIGGRGNLALQSSVVATFTPSFTNDTLGLTLINATVNGPGAVTNDTGSSLLMRASTINAPFTNGGSLFVEGSSAVGGSFTTLPASLIRVRGNGITGFSRLTAASGFTNNGTIVLTDTTAAYGAGLDVTTGVLVNAAGATILADTGFAGGRQLDAMIDNQAGGALVVAVAPAQALTLSKTSASHRNAGTLTLASGTLTVAGGSSSFANDTTGTIEGLGIFNVNAVAFSNFGSVRPGLGGPGILSITGNYPASPTESLHIELGGTTPGAQYDRLAVSGSAALGGALQVSLINGFTPALGDTFTVMTFASRSGGFGALNLPLVGGGLALDTVVTANGLQLVVVAPLLVHAADITADETWSAAGTHVVSSYVRILNGATLTIADGATVKFDSAAGLQVGDSTLGQAGDLVMLGTPGSIHLTANSPTPGPGFWQGLEVQKAIGPQIWRNVDIEYAGGARANPFNEACILLVDPAGGVDLDSVHIRQCVHAGVHHFAGSLHMHRSQIDSVTGSGIHAEYVTGAPVLRLDSTTIRGSGQEGLFIGNGFVNLVGATGNRFVGNAVAGVHIFGSQLSGFGLQDSIAGNGFGAGGFGDTIVVDSGTVGFGVPNFTIFRQAAPYLFTGNLNVWSPTGVNLTLDSGVVMAFDTAASMSLGDFADSAGNSSGVSANLVSLGTAASPVVLRNRLGRPGWGGLYLGAQSGTPVVRHLRLVHGGYQASFGGGREVIVIGFFEPLNANLWVDAPIGSAPFAIDSVVSDSSAFHGIVVKRGPPLGFQVRDNLIRQSAGVGLVARVRRFNPADQISGNTLTGNLYALDIPADVLPGLLTNSLTGNNKDTLLLHGGTLAVSDTLPQLGSRWRVTQNVTVDSGAVLSVLPGDTVTFDFNVRLKIGGDVPSALNAVGTSGSPIVFTGPTGLFWGGLEFANLSGAGGVSHLIVERAGSAIPCGGDCLPILFAAIRYSNVSASGLILDAVTVRASPLVALDVDSVVGSPLTVQNSQFYQNALSPMIRSPSPLSLMIHGSDLYHYNGQIIQTATGGSDSLDATGNWWGDAAALYAGFEGNDSLGRAALDASPVRFDVIAGPHFSVGPAAQLTPATDTALTAAINAIVGDPDSIRVRVLDAEGRGVAGTTIQWGVSSGAFQDPGVPSDIGGRAGGVWLTSTAANLQFVQATVPGLIGSPVTWAAFLQPDPTSAVDFQLVFEGPLGDTLTQGQVAADSNSVTFTSSGRRGVLVTHARDTLGNVTHPSGFPDFCFTDVPNSGVCHNVGWFSPFYGSIDSVKADSVFFTVTAALPATMQIRAEYEGGTFVDSIVINMNVAPVGVRITQDTALYGSLCPSVGPYNILCRRTFQAQLVDSAGSPLPPNDVYHFNWTNEVAGDTTVTIDAQSGMMGEFVEVTAHANGTASLVTQQTSGSPLVPDRGTLAITVNQVIANIAVTPDTVSAGLGDTVTFTASATDQGGTPMPGAVGWRQDAPAGQYLTIIDYPSASSIRVRLDSTYPSYPRDAAVITAYTLTAQGDTILGAGVIYNPIIVNETGLGAFPQGSALDPVRNRVYVVNTSSNNLSVFDGDTDKLIQTIDVGSSPASVAVNPVTGMIYVSNSAAGSVTVLDGTRDPIGIVQTISVGLNTGGIAVDTVRNRVYVGSLLRVAEGDLPFLSTIDGATNTLMQTDTVRFSGGGASAPGAVAFNPLTERAFVVLRTDTLAFVDVAGLTIKAAFGDVGFALSGVAVNTQTNLVYVGSGGEVKVIDATPGVDTVFTNVFIGANSAQGMSVNEKRNKVYVANASNNIVHEIDGASNAYRTVIVGAFSDFPQSATVNPETGKVYVPHASALTVLKYFTP
ncbi:MAG TPA: hypothetical protein VGJ83_07205 [Gemmatimonadales bacterium]